ncbi:hypothetical protein AX15_004434 [Amanita polypyramis BW_CC]|nr:hypothetical protein AX15_004434 [Amanita polypyramis BW_CC]
MRLRVQTIPPLPELKAWFIPRPTSTLLHLNTILELKQAICHDIKQLHQQHGNIRLLLDGFELLDSLPFDEVLRDGDLVCIQVSLEARSKSETLRKRKVMEDTEGAFVLFSTTTRFKRTIDLESAPKKRKKIPDVKISSSRGKSKRPLRESQLTSSSTSSSDSESDMSSSSSPDLGSESGSEGDSDESYATSSTTSRYQSAEPMASKPPPSMSSPPTPHPSGPSVPKRAKSSARATMTPVATPIPPGYGKPSTKSRNRRRRLKKMYERETKDAEQAPPKGISDTNVIPLGRGASESGLQLPKAPDMEAPEAERQNATEPLAGSQSAPSQNWDASVPEGGSEAPSGEIMMGTLRNKNKKKNFRRTMVAPATRKIVFDDSGNAQSAVPAASTKTGVNASSRVVPPSELAAQGRLPSNMFVTSVEFGRSAKKKKKKKKRDTCEEEEQVDNELQASGMYEGTYDDRLPYGDEEDAQGENDTAIIEDSQPQFDWEAAEAGWERFPPIQVLEQLRTGVLVCWQGLAINPQTFTPEHLLGVGRVGRVEDSIVKIRQILRPGTETSAAFGIGGGAGECEEEEYTWEDISGLGWKIIQLEA